MAVLGSGGRLVLKRDAPDVCLLDGDSLNPGLNTYGSICEGYWTGDRVNTDCLPSVAPGRIPGLPDQFSTYRGGRNFLGPNRDHITSNEDVLVQPAEFAFRAGQS